MNETNLILGFVNIFAGMLIIALSIPLLKGKIKMNSLYGVRFAKSFASESHWHKINRYGAKQMILRAVIIVWVGIAAFFLPLQENSLLTFVIAFAPVILVLIPSVQSYRYAKRL
jgi:hypothetical protein